MSKPLVYPWLVVKRILRSLHGTITYVLFMKPLTQLQLYGFAYANWGSNLDDQISTLRVVVFFGSSLVMWLSRKQHEISKSSIDDEHPLVDTISKLVWLHS